MKIQCNSFLWPCRRVFANGHLEQLREMVARAELKLPSKEELEKELVSVAESGEESLEGWHRYFTEKRAQLLAFLDQAIALGTFIRCSL